MPPPGSGDKSPLTVRQHSLHVPFDDHAQLWVEQLLPRADRHGMCWGYIGRGLSEHSNHSTMQNFHPPSSLTTPMVTVDGAEGGPPSSIDRDTGTSAESPRCARHRCLVRRSAGGRRRVASTRRSAGRAVQFLHVPGVDSTEMAADDVVDLGLIVGRRPGGRQVWWRIGRASERNNRDDRDRKSVV